MSDETPQAPIDAAAEVRAARGRLHINQEDAARMLGIRRERLSQIEGGGLRSSLRAREIFRFRKHLGIPLEVWEGYVEETP